MKLKYSLIGVALLMCLTEGAHSGVKYFVAESESNKGSAIGLEYQIMDDENNPDAKTGTPSDKNPSARKKIGERNQGMLRVYPDNKAEHWLKGYKAAEYVRGSAEFKSLATVSKYKVWENFGMAKEGSVLLQNHGGQVSFRSVKIKTSL